jgi:hypothetical protein
MTKQVVNYKNDETKNCQPTVVSLNSIQVVDKHEPMMAVIDNKFSNATVGNRLAHICCLWAIPERN